MNDPFNTIGAPAPVQQPAPVAAPVYQAPQPVAPVAPLKPEPTWIDSEGIVTEVTQKNSGTSATGKAWVMYKIKIQNTEGTRTYTAFNKAPNVNEHIKFKAKEEPYTNATTGAQGTSRTLIGFLPATTTPAPVAGIVNPVPQVQQPVPRQGPGEQVGEQGVNEFLNAYISTAEAPSIYEFIGVYMVKRKADIALVKQLVQAFNNMNPQI